MKILLLVILSFVSINLSAQDRDDDRHENNKHRKHGEYKRDYFTIGLYGGSYISKSPLGVKNQFLNSIAVEIEYFKFKDLSLYIKGLYQFSQTSLYSLEGIYERPPYVTHVTFQEPQTNRYTVSFGGRYYLGKKEKKINPYLQLGINHETNYIGNYYYSYTDYTGGYGISHNPYFLYRFSVNLGVGFNLKLNRRLGVDVKYDLYKSLDRNKYYSFDYHNNVNNNGFLGFSVLAGIKYNL